MKIIQTKRRDIKSDKRIQRLRWEPTNVFARRRMKAGKCQLGEQRNEGRILFDGTFIHSNHTIYPVDYRHDQIINQTFDHHGLASKPCRDAFS